MEFSETVKLRSTLTDLSTCRKNNFVEQVKFHNKYDTRTKTIPGVHDVLQQAIEKNERAVCVVKERKSHPEDEPEQPVHCTTNNYCERRYTSKLHNYRLLRHFLCLCIRSGWFISAEDCGGDGGNRFRHGHRSSPASSPCRCCWTSTSRRAVSITMCRNYNVGF